MTAAAFEHTHRIAAHLRDRYVVCSPTAADASPTRNVTTFDHLRFRHIHVNHQAHASSHSDRDRRWWRATQTP